MLSEQIDGLVNAIVYYLMSNGKAYILASLF